MAARRIGLGRLPFLQRVLLIAGRPVGAAQAGIGKARISAQHHRTKSQHQGGQDKFQVHRLTPEENDRMIVCHRGRQGETLLSRGTARRSPTLNRVKEADCIASVRFGAIHGSIGLLENIFFAVFMVDEQNHPDAGGAMMHNDGHIVFRLQ